MTLVCLRGFKYLDSVCSRRKNCASSQLLEYLKEMTIIILLTMKMSRILDLDLIGPDAVEVVPSDRIYIGFSDATNEGDWRWASGAKVSFSNWQTGKSIVSQGR